LTIHQATEKVNDWHRNSDENILPGRIMREKFLEEAASAGRSIRGQVEALRRSCDVVWDVKKVAKQQVGRR